MITACFVNQKGGVGKTASVVNIGAGLARLGRRVLLVDLDPQESMSYWLGITEPVRTVVDVFDGGAALGDCAVRHPGGFDVAPSQEMLAAVTPEVGRIRSALDGLEDRYDYVFLDCSPTLGMMTLAALTAADWVIVPLAPDLLSIKGLSQLLGTVRTVREQTNPALALRAVIATRYCGHKKMHRDILGQLRVFLADVPVFTVRENVAVAESPVAGRSVLDYRPRSAGALDYMAIARELMHG